MAKKKELNVSSSLDINDIANELNGLVEPLVDSKVLNSRTKVRSSVEVLNCLLGGGIPYGSVVGSFGPPSGGKSTEAYESAAQFLRIEPNGFVVILDMESSADTSRLTALGVDPSRVMRVSPTSISSGFDNLIDILKLLSSKEVVLGTKIPIFVIWDTISKGRAEDSEEASRMDARNRARVIKSRMSDIIPWLDKMDITLRLLNQVIIEVDAYGNAKQSAGGGVGLKHDEHLRLYIVKGKTTFDNAGISTEDISYITLDKTKLSPKILNIPIIFDITKGGKIDEERSFLRYMYDKGMLTQAGGWYSFDGLIDQLKELNVDYYELFKNNYGNKFRYSDMEDKLKEDQVLYALLRMSFISLIGSVYTLQREVMTNYYNELHKIIEHLLVKEVSEEVVINENQEVINN